MGQAAQKPEVRVADWVEDGNAIREIRERVFISEQNVPPELEWDEYDADSTHFLAYDIKRDAVGTGRLQPDGKITRMAVLPVARGAGVGAALLEALLYAAIHQGKAVPWLHAQSVAVGFYESFGFTAVGDPFMEAGIEHRMMRLSRT
ncbi:MAG: GNAT family N-acetyltransferase [Pseudomonadota bacterium]